MRNLKLVLVIVYLITAGTVTTAALAQSVPAPTVQIELSQPTAAQGDTVAADVYVRNGVNVAGIDIGITADETCLRITERQPGSYLPSPGTGATFSPLDELSDSATRFALALTDRSRNATGDGIFYSVQLEVTCEEGTAPLDFSYAKISSYVDPNAEAISLISYSLDGAGGDGILNAIGAQLAIGPAGEVTPIATVTSEAPAVDTSVTPMPAPTETAQQSQPLLIIAVVLMAAAVGGLLLLLLVARRSRRR